MDGILSNARPDREASRSATRRTAYALSFALAAGMAIQALLGIALPQLYRDVAWIKAAWFGTDLVTLLIAVPTLAGGLLAARRGSLRGELLWYSALAYGAYNYAYLMYGASLNPLFPLLVGLFVGSVWTLVLAVSTADVRAIAGRLDRRGPRRVAAAYAGLTGVGLAIAWLAQWAAFVFAAKVPSIGEGPFRLVASMDLSYMVPTFIVGAVLLWRGRPWGYLLATIAIVQGAAYTAGLTAASVIGGMRGLPGMWEQVPVWGVWTLAGVAAAALLLWRVRPAEVAQ